MERSAAARVLGIDSTASRGAARTAYMGLLQRASQELSPGSAEFTARQAQLRDAYASFGEDEVESAESGVNHSVTSLSFPQPQASRKRARNWAIVLTSAALLIALFVWGGANEGNQSPSGNNPTSQPQTNNPGEQSTTLPSATPAPPTSNGQSRALNTCWRDDVLDPSGGTGETTPVVQVDCGSTQAQWLAYREVTDFSQCPDLYLTFEGGWTLCIRPK